MESLSGLRLINYIMTQVKGSMTTRGKCEVAKRKGLVITLMPERGTLRVTEIGVP